MYISTSLKLGLVGALDKLLSQSLAKTISKQLGQKTFEKIEVRLKERYNLGVVDAIKDFYILDATLREFFGAGADNLEEDFLQHLISLQTPYKGRQWIIIETPDLSKLILESYGDKEKRLILNTAFKKPAPILDILDECKIPRSSGYRIINELVDDGLLTESGQVEREGKKVSAYTSLFEKVRMEIDNENVAVQVLLKEDVLNESQIVRFLRMRKQGKFV
jgi:hypothetical protein